MRIPITFLLLLTVGMVQAAEDPAGDWIWTGTEVSYGVFTTPEEAGYTMRWVLAEDREFLEFRDGLVVANGTYEFFDDTVTIPPDIVWHIQVLRFFFGAEESIAGYEVPDADHLKVYIGTNGFMPDYPAERFVRAGTVETDASTWDEVKALFR